MIQEIIERIKKGQFWQFPGGIKPQSFKDLSNQHEIERLPLPEILYLPVKQHVGVAGRILPEPGTLVLKGEPLTHSMNPFCVPVHAPTSGEIVTITDHVSCHPSGLPEKTIVLKPDGLEKWVDLQPVNDYQSFSRASLVELICSAGISGMGGAGFPTHIKLSSGKNIEFLIINGVECEPYITSDDRLMREHAWQIRQGIDVLCHILRPKQVLIAIEDNKPQAHEAMQIAVQDNPNYILCAVETVYPAGGEKQLIQVLTGREVPSKKLPIDIGVMMQNVGTCFAIADAIFSGKPLIERVVTLAGTAIEHSQNLWLPLGTPVEHAVDHCGYLKNKQKQKRLIMGGPMMGFTLHSPAVPVIKSSNCILVPSDKELPPPGDEMACIRCGACADACPAGLLPQQLYWHSKGKEFDKAQELNLFDCIECGACAYVCPSNIPLVHYYRSAKAEIRAQEEETEKAAKAKERFEARNERLERDKQEREEKARMRSEARQEARLIKEKAVNNEDSATETSKPASANDRVTAALARAKAKKAAKSTEPHLALTLDQKQGNEQETSQPKDETSSINEKQARVAAAIARAKAKKAAQSSDSGSNKSTVTVDDSTAVENSTFNKTPTFPEDQTSPEEMKKARVAAAIARAKAKKNTQNSDSESNEKSVTVEDSAPGKESIVNKKETSPEEQKKARVAAAIARAKAKKAAKQAQGDYLDQNNTGEEHAGNSNAEENENNESED